MLRNTFLHIPGVGKKTEKKLWKNKIRNWGDFFQRSNKVNISSNKRSKISNYLEKSIKCCNNKDYSFLIDNFPSKIHWRTYRELKEKGECCFLDIETTGLNKSKNKLTVVGIYNGRKSRSFIRGENLNAFPKVIKDYDLVVSFNGKRFDVPFLEEKFDNLEIRNNVFHIDLMYEMRKLGYSGGLKKIEKDLGISRSKETQGMGGYEAVVLWNKFKEGNRDALKTLLEYNKEDIENLEYLMDFAFRNLKEKRFGES